MKAGTKAAPLAYIIIGVGVGLLLGGWQGIPTVAQNNAEVDLHTHTHNDDEAHPLMHIKDSWKVVRSLENRVGEHIDAVNKNTATVKDFTDTVEELRKQCVSFEEWKKYQKTVNSTLEARTLGTLVQVGAVPCPEGDSDCTLKNDKPLDQQAGDIENNLRTLESIFNKPSWIGQVAGLERGVAECRDALGRAGDHIEAAETIGRALTNAFTPTVTRVFSSVAGDDTRLVIRFTVDTEAKGQIPCNDYLVFSSLENLQDGAIWSDVPNADSVGDGGTCEAVVRIPGRLAEYDRYTDIYIFPLTARTKSYELR